MSRGTSNECKVLVFFTVVDTTAYDASLGMEFIIAMGGGYDTYSEMFKYWWVGSNRLTRSFEISVPCHVDSPLLIAYACLGGLISSEDELIDVQGADDALFQRTMTTCFILLLINLPLSGSNSYHKHATLWST